MFVERMVPEQVTAGEIDVAKGTKKRNVSRWWLDREG
jgi:hypothetical protein